MRKVSGGRLCVYLCGLEKKGHPRGEGVDTSWTCYSEVFGYQLKLEEHDARKRIRARCYNAYPWKVERGGFETSPYGM